MRRATKNVLLAAVVGVLCAPVQAQAKAYISPWSGVVFGNDAAATGFRSVGVSFGDAGHGLVGTETNIGISPGFFGSRVENYVIDLMGDDYLFFASDIPHSDRMYDSPAYFLRRSDLSETAKWKILRDNARRFYGL